VVDPELSEKSSTSGPGQVDTLGAEYGTVDADEDGKFDGLTLHTFGDSDPAGTWRAVFTAADNGGVRSPAWRTHDTLRMLTANGEGRKGKFDLWIEAGAQSYNIFGQNVDWDYVRTAIEGKASVPYERHHEALNVAGTKLAEGAYLTANQQRRARFHTTTIFKTDESLGSRFPAYTRQGHADCNGEPATPDRSRVHIQYLET